MPSNYQKSFLILLTLTSINLSSSVNIQCEFKKTSKYTPMPFHYVCIVNGKLKVLEPGTKVDQIEGSHTDDRVNKDVLGIHIKYAKMNFLPNGFEIFFPDFTVLTILSSKLKEIRQYDLKPFLKLQYLMIDSNLLEFLEKDLFKYNKGLIYFNVNNNKIKRIDEKLFDDLKQLNFLNLLSNDCISMFGHGKNRVARIIKTVKEQCSMKKKKSGGTIWMIFRSWIFWVCLLLVVFVVFVVTGFVVMKNKLN